MYIKQRERPPCLHNLLIVISAINKISISIGHIPVFFVFLARGKEIKNKLSIVFYTNASNGSHRILYASFRFTLFSSNHLVLYEQNLF